MIKIDICLDDIPQEKISTAKNGKRYTQICVGEMRTPDKWGNTHTCWMAKDKEEPIIYVGKGTLFNPQQPRPQTRPQQPSPVDDFPADYQFNS